VTLCALLLAIGLVVIYSIGPAIAGSAGLASNHFVTRQMIAIGLSIVAFVITSRLPIERWRSFQKPLIIAAAVATVLALISPLSEQYQEHRWVRLGSLTFQSVELVKLAVLVWLATFLAMRMADGKLGDMHETFKPLLIAIGILGVVIAGAQSDLGSAGVLIAMMGTMMFVAGLPMKKVLMIGGIIGIGVILAVASTPYRRDRLTTFLNPTADCQDAGYQACQAMNAVGSGGLIGLGLGSSVQAYGYLPEAANDSIFAIYAEKFGFIGSIILLVILGALFSRIAAIAERAPDNFSRLLVVGVLTWLSVQSIVNIGAMLGLLPLKGITLPFISYGGTSVVFIAAAIGIVFQVSRYTSLEAMRMSNNNDRRGHNDDSRYRRGIRGAYHPDLSGRSRA
jgi:cell division protein FtsW